MAQNSLTSTSSKEVILSLKIDGGQALKTVVEAEKNVHDLKEQIKELNKEYKGKENEEYYKKLVELKTELKDQQNTLKANQRVLDEQVKAYKKNEDSINAMRANLKLLRAQYEDMSKAERESAKGTELLKKIQDQTAEIKKLEQAQGDFTRNVGNYQSVWDAEVEKIQNVGGVLASVFGSNGVIGSVVKATTVVTGFLRDTNKESQATQTQMQSLNQTISDTATESQKTSNVVENAGQSFQNLGSQIENTSKPIEGFGAAERKAADEAKNMGNATTEAAEAATEAAASETAAATATTGLSGAFKAAGTAVKAFSKQLLSLLANPYVAAFAAIVAIVMKLVDALKKNDKAMTSLKQAMSAFQPVLDVVNKLFSKMVDIVTKVVTVVGKAAKAIGGFFGGKAYKDAQARAEELIVAQDKLEDKEREYTLAHADNEAKIAELREIASDAENHTIEERKKALQEAEDIERADLTEKKSIAEEKVRLAEQEALQVRGWTEMTAEAWEALTDEEKDNITQLRAALRETDREMSDFERKMNKQMSSLNKSATSSSNSAATAKKERIKNEQEALRALEDAYIASIKDMEAKEIATLKSSNARKIQDLRTKLQTEKNLTKTARKAINKEIILIEAELQTQLADTEEKYQKQRLQEELNRRKEWYSTLLNRVQGDAKQAAEIELVKINNEGIIQGLNAALEAVTKARDSIKKDIDSLSDEEIKLKYGAEFDKTQLQALLVDYEGQVLATETHVSNMTEEIKKQEQLTITRITKEGMNAREALAQEYNDIINEIETTQNLEKFYYNEVEKTRILEEQAQYRLNVAKETAERLAQYSEEEQLAIYGTTENYQNALAQSQLDVVNAEVALADATRNTNQAILDQKERMIETFTTIGGAINDVVGSFQSIFDTLAESDEKYKKYSTALAMAQILVSTAISIANAIQGATAAAAATGPGAPIATPIFIAEMVAIVSGAIASAVATLKKAQNSSPSKPKFSHGGLVGDRTTTRTDDTVDAKLSKGEYVIRSKVVNELGVDFFDKLNGKKLNRQDIPFRFSTGGAVPSMTTIAKTEANFDYTQMKEIFSEVVSEIQPVVSVREINDMQTRVSVKEQTASYE